MPSWRRDSRVRNFLGYAMNLKTSKEPKDLELPLLGAIKEAPLKFDVTKYNEASDIFAIEAVHEFTTALDTSAGRRQCVIVGSRTKDDETQILFKVLEFKVEAKEKFSIGNMLGAPSEVNYLPIQASEQNEKLRGRLAEGVSNVTAAITGVLNSPTASKQ